MWQRHRWTIGGIGALTLAGWLVDAAQAAGLRPTRRLP
jgi:hypothetical protein